MLSNIYLEYLNNYEHVQWISFLLSHPTIIGVSKGNILLTYGESGLQSVGNVYPNIMRIPSNYYTGNEARGSITAIVTPIVHS